MNTQQGDQRLVYTVQALCLNMDEVELPKDNSICAEHHQDDEHEARYQPVTDVESSYPTAEFCRSVPLHRLVLSSYRSSQAHATTHSFSREAQTDRAEGIGRFRLSVQGLMIPLAGGPFSKPVMRTNSFSKAVAASGALLAPVSTECTACM